MLKTLASDTIQEPVKQFFGEMEFTDEPATFEVNGRRVYFVVRPVAEPVTPDPSWTEAQAKRRHLLIDLKLSGAISGVELLELAQLNEEFQRYTNRVAPLPMSYALDLLANLSAKSNAQP